MFQPRQDNSQQRLFLEPQHVHVVRVNRMLPINNTPRRPKVLWRQDRIDPWHSRRASDQNMAGHSVTVSCHHVCVRVPVRACATHKYPQVPTREPREPREPHQPGEPHKPHQPCEPGQPHQLT